MGKSAGSWVLLENEAFDATIPTVEIEESTAPISRTSKQGLE